MRILFLHRSFPGQFRYLAPLLAGENQIVFLTTAADGEIPGVRRMQYLPRSRQGNSHHYVLNLQNALSYGEAAAQAALELKREGFLPDLIIGHSGWGPTLFMKDLFPQAALLCYFEWFYRASGSSHGFNPDTPVTDDNAAEIRMKNAAILTDLCSCDAGISPTVWQRSQFPAEFHKKISVIHDGVDTNYFSPRPVTSRTLPRIGLDLKEAAEVVTYVATGMEPIRGFPQFMEAVSLLQQRRPKCHVVIVGEDRVEYCNPLPGGKTYRQAALEAHPFDLSRLHFTGRLSLEEYRQILYLSSVHVYLTYPYILSWSMIEAMACGCAVVGSDTPPVAEVIENGRNGLLADFFATGELADCIEQLLDQRTLARQIGLAARQTIMDRYDLSGRLKEQLFLVNALTGRS